MKFPRKRLFRFSLRTMLVVVTVLCVLLGWKVYQVNKQKRVVAWVWDMGGAVVYDYEDYKFDEECVWVGTGPGLPGPDWLCELVGVDYFATILMVGLSNTQVSDLSPLENLTNLEQLFLLNTPISEVSPLAKLTRLKTLDLGHTQVTDLSPLANLTKLKTLWLNDTNVTDEEVAKLQKALPNCRISH